MPEIVDLGALGKPQQLQVIVGVLARQAQGLPPELVDANSLVEMIRIAVREEIERSFEEIGLLIGEAARA